MPPLCEYYELLRAYVERGDEAAFARVVEAYVGLVFSAAMRQVRNRDLAQEVTHVVFIVLAKKAKSFRADVVLSAWLHKTTRFTSLNILKVQARRARHERKAAEMTPETPRTHSSWHRLSPMLDEAVARLGDKDRSAITLRFFERKTPAEVGREMGITEDAAAMRISRAVAKLRGYFKDRRVDLDAEMLGAVILAHAAISVPQGLSGSVSAGAQAAVHAGTVTISAGTSGASVCGSSGSAGAGSAISEITRSAIASADDVIRAMFLARARAAALLVVMILAAMLFAGIFTKELLIPLFHQHTRPLHEGQALANHTDSMRQIRTQLISRRDLIAMGTIKATPRG